MEISQITSLDADVLFDILSLTAIIKQNSFTLKQYARFIIDYCSTGGIGLFAVFNDGKIVAYLQTARPHPLEPKIGYIPIAASSELIPANLRRGIIKVAEQWLISKGATCWRTKTTRNPALWKRRYGLECVGKVAGEYILEKTINVSR